MDTLVGAIRSWARDCWPAWGVGGALAILAVFVGGPLVVPLFMPMGLFYEMRSVTIADTTAGVSPRVIVDRTIHRDFRGRYEVEIMRAEGAEFSVWWECGSHVSDWRWYREDAVLPPNMDLDWWMGIPPNRECVLPPGTYKVRTTLYALGPFRAELSTTVGSNVFKVMPAR